LNPYQQEIYKRDFLKFNVENRMKTLHLAG